MCLPACKKLMDREPPVAALLPASREPRKARYAHLLSGPVESIQFAPAESGSLHDAAPSATPSRSDSRALSQLWKNYAGRSPP